MRRPRYPLDQGASMSVSRSLQSWMNEHFRTVEAERWLKIQLIDFWMMPGWVLSPYRAKVLPEPVCPQVKTATLQPYINLPISSRSWPVSYIDCSQVPPSCTTSASTCWVSSEGSCTQTWPVSASTVTTFLPVSQGRSLTATRTDAARMLTILYKPSIIQRMSRQPIKYPSPSRQNKLLKSFYQQRPPNPVLSPDTHSLGPQPEPARKVHNSSLPRAALLSSRNSQAQSRPIASPKHPRSSVSPKAIIAVSQREEPARSNDKSYHNRYHLKQALERHNKKQHTSPHSFEQAQKEEDRQSRREEETRMHDKKDGATFNVKSLLTAEEYGKFGERFPEKFKRVGLLGRGGFSVVWLGVHKASKRKVAVKQILSKNPYETHLKEIWFCTYFFDRGGQPREEFEGKTGINNICRLFTYDIQSQDSWLYYELCEQSLGSSLFELKGETLNGERSYRIQYGELLYRMRSNPRELRQVVVEIAKALTLINSHNIVHSDLKTENIMIKTRRGEPIVPGQSYIRSLKLIDFGSSFLFSNLRQFSMATPEYMPPEILNYILFQNKMEHDVEMLRKMSTYKNAWTIDIWSLGCIVLEIVSGVPLWMSVNTRVPTNSGTVTGLFSAKNRVFAKIIQKQIEVVEQLDQHIKEHNYSGIIMGEDLKTALKQMLCLEPMERISPWGVLELLGVKCEQPVVPAY